MNNTNISKMIENKIKTTLITNKLIQNNDKIVVGVSGGPDSMCLLNSLITIKEELKSKNNITYNIFVAHVNHMIREESEKEKNYVENFCKKYDIPFYYHKADVSKIAKDNKISEETCGRNIRYEFFNNVLNLVGANKIAVAHNLDDNVETILLNILRGSGLKGIGGMRYRHENIIRPMLDIEKKDIILYCEYNDIQPCLDSTNFQDLYKRNKIRLNLIPMLKNEYNPNLMQNILRMSKIAQAEEDFIQKYTKKTVEKIIISEYNNCIEFTTKDLLNEHEAIIHRVIREIICKLQKNLDGIENIHVLDIEKLIKNNIKGKKYIIGNKFTVVIKSKFIANIYKN